MARMQSRVLNDLLADDAMAHGMCVTLHSATAVVTTRLACNLTQLTETSTPAEAAIRARTMGHT